MRGPVPVVLAGVLLAAVVYALVAGSRPVYESQAVVAATSPALLIEYDRIIHAATEPVAAEDRKLTAGDLGNVGGAVEQARVALGSRGRGSDVEIEIDAEEGEASIVGRAHDARSSRALADGVAAAIVTERTLTTFLRLESATQELRLVAALARPSPELRPRVAALRRQIRALNALARTPSGGLEVLRQAQTPREPVGPRVGRDVLLAAVFGMLGAVTVRALWRAAPARLRRPRRLGTADA